MRLTAKLHVLGGGGVLTGLRGAQAVSERDSYILIDGRVCLPNCQRVYRGATHPQARIACQDTWLGKGDRAVTWCFLSLMALLLTCLLPRVCWCLGVEDK